MCIYIHLYRYIYTHTHIYIYIYTMNVSRNCQYRNCQGGVPKISLMIDFNYKTENGNSWHVVGAWSGTGGLLWPRRGVAHIFDDLLHMARLKKNLNYHLCYTDHNSFPTNHNFLTTDHNFFKNHWFFMNKVRAAMPDVCWGQAAKK